LARYLFGLEVRAKGPALLSLMAPRSPPGSVAGDNAVVVIWWHSSWYVDVRYVGAALIISGDGGGSVSGGGSGGSSGISGSRSGGSGSSGSQSECPLSPH
jgi:hypothetical protein